MLVANPAAINSPVADINAMTSRRYDIDAVRSIALVLLIIYHCSISFVPWASSIGYPQNERLLEWFWPAMAALNIWRIPILFLISGMGVYFALQRRSGWQLVQERASRILLPFLFCFFVLGGFLTWLLPALGWREDYSLHFGHLWFLLNIFVYILLLTPLFVFWKANPDNRLSRSLTLLLRKPAGLFFLAVPLIAESVVVAPMSFSSYAFSLHGFVLGLVLFALGFLLVSCGTIFWTAIEKYRWIALWLALGLYLVRLIAFELTRMPYALVSIESMHWMLAALGFAAKHLNAPSRLLSYASKAVFPVYIVHQPVQFLVASVLLPLPLAALWKFTLLSTATLCGSVLIYEYLLRRSGWLKPLFGIPLKPSR